MILGRQPVVLSRRTVSVVAKVSHGYPPPTRPSIWRCSTFPLPRLSTGRWTIGREAQEAPLTQGAEGCHTHEEALTPAAVAPPPNCNPHTHLKYETPFCGRVLSTTRLGEMSKCGTQDATMTPQCSINPVISEKFGSLRKIYKTPYSELMFSIFSDFIL